MTLVIRLLALNSIRLLHLFPLTNRQSSLSPSQIGTIVSRLCLPRLLPCIREHSQRSLRRALKSALYSFAALDRPDSSLQVPQALRGHPSFQTLEQTPQNRLRGRSEEHT